MKGSIEFKYYRLTPALQHFLFTFTWLLTLLKKPLRWNGTELATSVVCLISCGPKYSGSTSIPFYFSSESKKLKVSLSTGQTLTCCGCVNARVMVKFLPCYDKFRVVMFKVVIICAHLASNNTDSKRSSRTALECDLSRCTPPLRRQRVRPPLWWYRHRHRRWGEAVERR